MLEERELILDTLRLKRKAREEKLKKQVEEERERLKQRSEIDDWDVDKLRKFAEVIKQETGHDCKRQKTEIAKQEVGDREQRRKEEGERLRKQVQEELRQQKVKREEAKAFKAGQDDQQEKADLPNESRNAKVDLANVKQEVSDECTVPGRTSQQLLAMTNQEIWQHAWDVMWKKADAMGKASDEKFVYAQAQKSWKSWMAERDHLQRISTATGSRKQLPETVVKCKEPVADPPSAAVDIGSKKLKMETVSRNESGSTVKAQEQGSAVSGGKKWNDIKKESVVEVDPTQAAQELNWKTDRKARSDWERLTSDCEKSQDSDKPKTARDLCALVKERCPADQPLPFERLLAACPKGTTVRQLIQALAKDPRDFRQDYQGKEFCVRPANSRCVDWLPVQASTTPPDFREDASLPGEMLSAAKNVFEQRLKPQGQSSENPLVVFLSLPGRLPLDTPLPFDDFIKRCPPGTTAMDLIRAMSKRRDVFRQNKDGSQYCIKPQVKCRDWGAVNPYMDPTKKPQPKSTPVASQPSAKKEEVSDEE